LQALHDRISKIIKEDLSESSGFWTKVDVKERDDMDKEHLMSFTESK